MNDQERKHKVTKKESYQNEIQKIDKKETFNTLRFAFFLGAAIIFGSFAANTKDLFEKVSYTVTTLLATYNIGLSVKDLVKGLLRKNTCQSKIEDIDEELEFEKEFVKVKD